jgi:signal transduction histidine kinase
MCDVILALKRLSAMRERAEAISAEFDLDSKPRAGTRIYVRLLLKDLS